MPAPSKLTSTRAANLLAGFLLLGAILIVWGGLAVVLGREFFLYLRG
jgi:hypothetical protein